MSDFFKSILLGINSVVNNYGWSIILFTLIIRLIVLPFDYKSRVGMRKMTKLQPEVQRLQKKYAKDQEKLNAKVSELYKKNHANPLSSCLPMLISMPILYIMWAAMRNVANDNLVAQVFDILQGNAPHIESWLWIKNVWMPDSPFAASWPDLNSLRIIPDNIWLTAFNALPQDLLVDGGWQLSETLRLTADSFSKANLNGTIAAIGAYMNTMPAYIQATAGVPGWSNLNLWITSLTVMQQYNGFFILPVLSAVTQYLMTILQPTTPEAPAANGQQNGTANFMKWFFPLFSLWICCSYNAIFALYWVTSNVLAAIQNVIINWYLDKKEQKNTVEVEGSVK